MMIKEYYLNGGKGVLEEWLSWFRWQLTTVNSSSSGSDTLTQTYIRANHQCTLNKNKLKRKSSLAWWHVTSIPALGRQKQQTDTYELRASMVSKVSSRTARGYAKQNTTQANICACDVLCVCMYPPVSAHRMILRSSSVAHSVFFIYLLCMGGAHHKAHLEVRGHCEGDGPLFLPCDSVHYSWQ